jgi:hypothetical protein
MAVPAQQQPWQNRIVGHEEVAPDQLLAHPHNARVHPLAQQKALGQVLDRIGFIEAVIVNETTGHVVNGHLRVELALSRGEATIPVEYVRLSEEEEAIALATFDPLGSLAVTDAHQLSRLLEDVAPLGPEADAMLSDLLHASGGTSDGSNEDGDESANGGGATEQEIPEQYAVLVSCDDETQQAALLERLIGEGFTCKALLS